MARKTKTETELDDILERVTRTEEELKHAGRMAETTHRETSEALDKLGERLSKLESALTRYQGLWGGIMLVLTAVGAALAMFKGFIFRKLGWVLE
ncbi:MAG: hypothetical protein AB7Q37_18590 [Pyrinomonadaceae bacterium]